jgi:Ca-activated chloride channel family protein
MDRLFAKLDRPALSDVQLQWPAGAEPYPAQLPDLYAGEPLLAVAKLPPMQTAVTHAEPLVRASGWSPQGEWQDALRLARATPMDGVARLWGRSKIVALEDALRQGADVLQLRPEIVQLGIEHQLVSRYTSLIAVDRTPARPKSEGLTSLQFDNAAPHAALAFAQGGTDARRNLGLAFLCALLALTLLPKRAVGVGR